MSQTFHDHFSGIAGRYADFRPHYPQALFNYLATLVPRNSFVWDCAAGNGQATLDLANRFNKIIATDASPQQIASAKAHPNVEYRVAPAEQSGLAEGTIGLITVAQAVHWFDLDRFYAEVRRVLRPGGILAVWGYGIDTVEGDAVNQILLDFYWNVVGHYWPPERKTVENEYRTLPFPFRKLSPPLFHMEERWTFEQMLGYVSTWSATTRYIKAKGENPVESLAERLLPEWGTPDKPRRVTWPLPLLVGKV